MPTTVLLSSLPITNTHLLVGVLCIAITDEGSRKLPKHLKFVTLLASVYEPQSGTHIGAITSTHIYL